MKKLFTKRTLALLLIVVLILCTVPAQFAAFAGETPADVLLIDDENAVNEGGVQQNIANWASTIETNIVKVGSKSLKSSSGSDYIAAAQYVWRNSLFNSPKNITAVTSNGTAGAVRFWFYVEDINTFDAKKQDETTGLVKIGTAALKADGSVNVGPDAGNFYRWKGWTTQVTKSGWNEIILKISDAEIQNAAPDLTCINKFLITYPSKTASTVAYIDNFRVSADTEPVSDRSDVLLIDDENAVNESGNQANIANWASTIEKSIVKVGTKSLKSTTSLGTNILASQYVWRNALFNQPKDIKAVTKNGTDGAVRFWLYVPDISSLDNAKAKEASGKKSVVKIGTTAVKADGSINSGPDAGNFYRWNGWLNQVTHSGWNEVVLKIADAEIQNGVPTLTNIDKFMILYPDGTGDGVVTYLDNFHVSANTEHTYAVKLPVEGKKTSKGLFNIEGNGFVVDASSVVDPCLKVSIYIAKEEDPTASVSDLLGKRQIELTSGGTFDKEEIHWDMTLYTLSTGWNTLYLPFSIAQAQDDGVKKFDVSRINWFRTYTLPSNSTAVYTLEVKDVSIIGSDIKVASSEPIEIDLPVDGKQSGAGGKDMAHTGFAIDASNLEDPHLQISYYVARDDDPTSIEGIFGFGEIELTSAGKPDNAEIHWKPQRLNLKAGWNTLSLPFSEAFTVSNDGSAFDVSAINYFRAYLSPSDKTVSFTLEIKDIAIVGKAKEAAKPEPIEIDLPIEGKGSGTGEQVIIVKDFEVDASGLTDMYLKASLYVARNDNPASVEGIFGVGELELTSSGGEDVAEVHWRTHRIGLKAGWNELMLPFAAGDYLANGFDFDPASINFFRLYTVPADKNIEWTLEIKDVAIIGTPAVEAAPLVIDLDKSQSGTGGKDISKTGFKLDASKFKNPHLQISYYVARDDDPTSIEGIFGAGEIELTSAGKQDKAEIHWKPQRLSLKAGWNTLTLPFSQAFEVFNGTDFDPSSINYFRAYINSPADKTISFTLHVKDISIVDVQADEEEENGPVDNTPTIKGAKMFQAFEEKTGLRAEDSFKTFGFDTEEKKQGNSSLKIVSNIGKIIYTYKLGDKTFDATGYNAVEFDLYVSNPEYFEYGSGQLEFTSSGTCDQNEIAWNLKELQLNEGWNHVKLSFDFAKYSADFTGAPDVDFSKINYMRLYTMAAENYVGKDITFRFDNMCFTKNGEVKMDRTVTTTNDTGYEFYLTAKPEVIPSYGEIVVTQNNINDLPEQVRKLFKDEKNTVILTSTYYKDSIEYHFKDSVTVHLSQEKFADFKNKYVYRLDVNGSFKQLKRIDNKSSNELTWEETARLATYIISDALLEDEVVQDVENELVGELNKGKSVLPIVIGSVAGGLVILLAGVIIAVIVIKKRKTN